MSEPNPSAHDVAHDPNYVYCNPVAGGCGKQKKHDKFRVGAGICLACEDKSRRDENEVRTVAVQQRAAARQIGKLLLEQEKRKHLGLPATSQVLNMIMERFGGYEAYADWYYRNAIESEEGSKTALDAAHRLMTTLVEANRQEMGHDVESMNDEELVAMLGQAALKARANIVDGTAKRIEQQDADE